MNDPAPNTAPLIAVDIGNRRIKVGRFDSSADDETPSPNNVLSCRRHDLESSLADWLNPEPASWWVSSVERTAEQRLAEWVAQFRPRDTYRKLESTDVPLEIRVDSPELTGMDRLMAAVAANRLREPARPAIVIDAGSAITVEAIDRDGAYLGGAILPGASLAAAALSRDTDLLPTIDVSTINDPAAIGKTTDAAIQSGLRWGTLGAVRELVSRISTELSGSPQLFLTGGDADQLRDIGAANVDPHLVLVGIASTAKHHERSN